jgi:hypothetical protein
MTEYILLGGLSFVTGLLVGRHMGMEFMKARLVHYMTVVSAVQNILHAIHTEHGIEKQVAKALSDAGYALQRVQTGGG